MSDFNDWTPVFVNIDAMGADGIPIIQAHVQENITAGADILTVQATDDDIGDNAVIEYMITSGNDNGLFQINQQTGKISLASDKTLDYDIKQSHRMQVSRRGKFTNVVVIAGLYFYEKLASVRSRLTFTDPDFVSE